jgi:hypothetical protein
MYAVTIALAGVSYELVEQPLRRADFNRAWQRFRTAAPWRRAAVATSGVAAAAMAAGLVVAVTTAPGPDLPEYFETPHIVIQGRPVSEATDVVSVLGNPASASSADILGVAPGAPSALLTDPATVEPATGEVPASLAIAPGPEGEEAVADQLPLPDRNDCEEMRGTAYRSYAEREFFLANCIRRETTVVSAGSTRVATIPSLQPVSNARVTAIGDSVMLGAAPQMASLFPNIDFDSAVSRQVSTAIQLLRQRAANNALGEYVVIAMGNNGTFTAGQFDDIMSIIGPNRRAIFVTVKVARNWENGNNNVIREGVARHPNAVLADWRAFSQDRSEFFWNDLIHLRPEGAYAYATLIAPHIK